jgi:hypothetical protein
MAHVPSREPIAQAAALAGTIGRTGSINASDVTLR